MKVRSSFLRKVAAIAACLAVTTMLLGCEKDPIDDPNGTGNVDGIDVPDAIYYGDEQNALQIALRNVQIKYSYQNPLATDKSIVDAEAMTCKGRAYVKGTHMDAAYFKRDGYDNYAFVICNPPSLYKAYSFDDNEWFSMNYADWSLSPNIVSSILGNIGTRQVNAMEQYLLKDKKENYWDEPYIYETSNGNYRLTHYRLVENQKTIAGILCDGYSVNEKHEYPNTPQLNMEYIRHKVWYDPKTSVVMRYEDYREKTATTENLLQYWFEVNEIEYGKVKVSEMDAILDNYLKTHTPKDISDDDEVGVNW